jgi:hypothetical protein
MLDEPPESTKARKAPTEQEGEDQGAPDTIPTSVVLGGAKDNVDDRDDDVWEGEDRDACSGSVSWRKRWRSGKRQLTPGRLTPCLGGRGRGLERRLGR